MKDQILNLISAAATQAVYLVSFVGFALIALMVGSFIVGMIP